MQETQHIPLFPLSKVLVPTGKMELQIFEPRYIDLIKHCMKTDTGFGIVRIEKGSEVLSQLGAGANLRLGRYGSYAKIVDFNTLPNGLLGITVQGQQRFAIESTEVAADGLISASVDMQGQPQFCQLDDSWQSLQDVLRSLEAHPHIEQMQLDIDYDNAWQVAYALVQLLPMDEEAKYQFLAYTEVEELLQGLDDLLSQLSGEEISDS